MSRLLFWAAFLPYREKKLSVVCGKTEATREIRGESRRHARGLEKVQEAYEVAAVPIALHKPVSWRVQSLVTVSLFFAVIPVTTCMASFHVRKYVAQRQ